MKTSMNIRLTRRKLVQWFAVMAGHVWGARLPGVAGLGASALASSGCSTDEASPEPSANHPPKSDLHDAIRKHYDYLAIDDAVIEAFASDLVRNQGPWSPETSPRPFTRFLASTDFFQNDADESRPLEYVTYYDPYVSACYNPFTDTMESATSQVDPVARARGKSPAILRGTQA